MSLRFLKQVKESNLALWRKCGIRQGSWWENMELLVLFWWADGLGTLGCSVPGCWSCVEAVLSPGRPGPTSRAFRRRRLSMPSQINKSIFHLGFDFHLGRVTDWGIYETLILKRFLLNSLVFDAHYNFLKMAWTKIFAWVMHLWKHLVLQNIFIKVPCSWYKK